MPRGPTERNDLAPVGCAVHVMKIATGEIEEALPENREDKVNGGKARRQHDRCGRSELARTAARARWAREA